MRRKRCIICGKALKRSIKLPHGNLNLCTQSYCQEQLTVKINDGNMPVVWFSSEDMSRHAQLSPEAFELMKNPSIFREVTCFVTDYLWSDDYLGELFGESIQQAARDLEALYIERADSSEIPLINMNDLIHKGSKDILQRRLKGGN